MTKKEKKQAATAAAVLALLLLLWKTAGAKTKPVPKITVGPIDVYDRDETNVELQRQKRAALRYKVLDLIAWNEDTGEPSRRPTTADNIVLDAITKDLTALREQIPDPTPEKFDTLFDQDLDQAIAKARALDPSTSSRPASAFGSSRYMTRLINIEKAIADVVAMDMAGQPQRKPTAAENATASLLLFEADDLRRRVLELDPEAEVAPLDLKTLLAVANELPSSTSAVAATSAYRGAVA